MMLSSPFALFCYSFQVMLYIHIIFANNRIKRLKFLAHNIFELFVYLRQNAKIPIENIQIDKWTNIHIEFNTQYSISSIRMENNE